MTPILPELGLITEGTERSFAVFSPCKKYRYLLGRVWGVSNNEPPRLAAFTLLNPSTADAFKLDPTLTRCMGFAERLGCQGMLIANVFAFRSTDPKKLLIVKDPVGPHNVAAIGWMLSHPHAAVDIAGWGAMSKKLFCSTSVIQTLVAAHDTWLYCFGKTKAGHPKHPLYLRSDTPLVRLSDGKPWLPMPNG